jgi:hypothetical protein
LGFRLVERTIERRVGLPAPDTITVALERVPFVLAASVTTATDRCHTEPDSVSKALSVPALDHIRLGAERYEAFRRAYPFRVQIERRTIRLDDLL